MEALTGLRSGVMDPFDEEIGMHGYQDLQPHQDAVIKVAEQQVAELAAKVTAKGL